MTLPCRVLANSLPRGGPFLLASALDLLGYRRFSGAANTPRALNYLEAKKALQQGVPAADTPDAIGVSLFAPLEASPATVQRWLTTVANGEYIMGHMPYSPRLQSVMADLQYRQVVIVRDPRALLLALICDEQVMPRFLAADFATLSPLQQVERMWEGGYLPQADVTIQPFAAVYRSMLAWRDQPATLLMRFEELIGPPGGGSLVQQQQALARLATFLGLSVDEAQMARVEQIADPSAHTFSLSQKALWPTRGAPEAVEFVEHRCAMLREEAGYS